MGKLEWIKSGKAPCKSWEAPAEDRKVAWELFLSSQSSEKMVVPKGSQAGSPQSLWKHPTSGHGGGVDLKPQSLGIPSSAHTSGHTLPPSIPPPVLFIGNLKSKPQRKEDPGTCASWSRKEGSDVKFSTDNPIWHWHTIADKSSKEHVTGLYPKFHFPSSLSPFLSFFLFLLFFLFTFLFFLYFNTKEKYLLSACQGEKNIWL